MRQLLLSWLSCCALAASGAPAAPTAAPATPGACALALQDKQAQPQPQQPQQQAQHDAPRQSSAARKKVNMDFLLDPCKLADAEKDSDVANNDGKSAQEIFDQVNDWVEWNRRFNAGGGETLPVPGMADAMAGYGDGRHGHGLPGWGGSLASDRFAGERTPVGLEPAGMAPAVPEPAMGWMLPGGLALLALWRRRAGRQ